MSSAIHHLLTQYPSMADLFHKDDVKPLSYILQQNDNKSSHYYLAGLAYNLLFLPYKLSHGLNIFQKMTSTQEKLDRAQYQRGFSNLALGSAGSFILIIRHVIQSFQRYLHLMNHYLIKDRKPSDFLKPLTYALLIKDCLVFTFMLIPTSLQLVLDIALTLLESINRIAFGAIQIALFPLNFCTIAIRSLNFNDHAAPRNSLSHPVNTIFIEIYNDPKKSYPDIPRNQSTAVKSGLLNNINSYRMHSLDMGDADPNSNADLLEALDKLT